MAPDKKDKKRKAPAAAVAPAADSPAKKTKKASETPKEKSAPKPALKKTKDTEDKSSAKPKKANDEKPTRQVKPRKRAADFLTDDESAEEEAAPVKAKAEAEAKKSSNKKSKKEDGSAAPAPKAATKTASAKASPKASKKVEAAEDSDEDDASAASGAGESDDNEDEEDDQTAALIRGFESSGDEDESGDEGFDPSKPVPKIPDSKKTKRKLLKKQKEEKSGNSEEPGTVYIGRIPHGFYEHQMRAYFSQFGEITRLRLSRNRLTGRSKHYAFVEFSSTSVAKIVAGTMDNYLMYGHILKCKYVPAEQLHPEIWKGANRRFKHTPWNRIEKKRLDKGKTREQWAERIEREQKRRLAKAEKLKAVGYEFDMPELMSVDQVPVQEETKAVEAAEEPTKAIEEAPAAAEKETKETKADDTQKKSKKEKKQPASEQGTPKQSTPKQGTPKQGKAAPNGDVTPSSASKAAKKGGKKSKAKA